MANIAAGLFMGGAAENRAVRERAEVQRDELEMRRQQAARKAIAEGINATRSEIETLIKAAQAAKEKGAPPEKIAPIRRLIETIGSQLGVPVSGVELPAGITPVPGSDKLIAQSLQRFDAIVGATPPGAGEGPNTELGKLQEDLQRGFITQDDYNARVERLTKPDQGPNTVELIRRKLATGQPLSPGEQQVYDDALRADPLARLLLGPQGGQQQQPAPVSPRPTFNAPKFSTPHEIEAALEAGDVKIGDVVILNGQRVRIDP